MAQEQSQPQEIELKEPIKDNRSPSGFTIIEGVTEKPIVTPEPEPIPSPVAILDGRVVQAIAKVDGKFVFSQAEKEMYIKISKSKSAEVEELQPLELSKCEGIKYETLDEAIKHIEHDEPPESETIPQLKRELAEARATIAELATVQIEAIKSRVGIIEADIVAQKEVITK